jgi:hypothetical protein
MRPGWSPDFRDFVGFFLGFLLVPVFGWLGWAGRLGMGHGMSTGWARGLCNVGKVRCAGFARGSEGGEVTKMKEIRMELERYGMHRVWRSGIRKSGSVDCVWMPFGVGVTSRSRWIYRWRIWWGRLTSGCNDVICRSRERKFQFEKSGGGSSVPRPSDLALLAFDRYTVMVCRA